MDSLPRDEHEEILFHGFFTIDDSVNPNALGCEYALRRARRDGLPQLETTCLGGADDSRLRAFLDTLKTALATAPI